MYNMLIGQINMKSAEDDCHQRKIESLRSWKVWKSVDCGEQLILSGNLNQPSFNSIIILYFIFCGSNYIILSNEKNKY